MLLGLNAGDAGRALAEIEKAADFVAEASEGLVVDSATACDHSLYYIVLRYK